MPPSGGQADLHVLITLCAGITETKLMEENTEDMTSVSSMVATAQMTILSTA